MIRRRSWAALALAATLPLLTGIGYRTDDRGGPLFLADDVAAAFASWIDAGEAGLVAEPDPEGEVLFRFPDPGLLGPDTLSLTLRTESGSEVLLSPDYRSTPAVLLHETGLLLGVPVRGDGVMAPAFGPDTPAAPTESDLAALADTRRFPPADLTRDGVVDFDDLVAFGDAFGTSGVNVAGDLDGDGTVDAADLALLREAYTFTPPSAEPEPEAPSDADGAEPDPLDTAEPGAGQDDAATEPPADPAPEDPPPDEPGSDDEGEPEPPPSSGQE